MVVGILNALTTEALGTRYIQRHKKKGIYGLEGVHLIHSVGYT